MSEAWSGAGACWLGKRSEWLRVEEEGRSLVEDLLQIGQIGWIRTRRGIRLATHAYNNLRNKEPFLLMATWSPTQAHCSLRAVSAHIFLQWLGLPAHAHKAFCAGTSSYWRAIALPVSLTLCVHGVTFKGETSIENHILASWTTDNYHTDYKYPYHLD